MKYVQLGGGQLVGENTKEAVQGSAKAVQGSAGLCYGFIKYGYRISKSCHKLVYVIGAVKLGFLE